MGKCLKAVASCACLAVVAAPAWGGSPGTDFDQGVRVGPVLERTRQESKSTPSPEALPEDAVWVSFSIEDLQHPGAKGFPLENPVFSSARSSVFRVAPERLPELGAFMHEKFGRCGGFFAHGSRLEAEADLRESVVRAAAAYTLDQQAVVAPLVGQVKESQLRAVIEGLAAHHTRYYQHDAGVAAAKWLQARWQASAAALPGASAQLVTHASWRQPSVVLTFPGSETPDEVVVLGGHLDSIGGMWGGGDRRAPGADDNASGIAVLSEAARILSQAGWRPKKTVQFMGYAAEEVGLRGSKEIADRYAREGKKVVGVIQLDMTNFRGSADAIYLLSDNVDPALTAFLGRLVETYSGVPLQSTACGYACSDHASWTRAGFPASAAFESAVGNMNPNIHTPRDTLDNSGGTAEHSVAFAKLAVAFAVELAKTAASAPAAASR